MTAVIHARGATLPEVFARAALAVLAQAIAPDSILEREVREVRAHGRTAEALLAHFIQECLYVHEVEGFAWRRIDFAIFEAEPATGAEPMRLHSFLHGEELDPKRPRLPTAVDLSSTSVHLQSVDGGYQVRIQSDQSRSSA